VLEGVRVLDFTWVVGGPLATRMLASMGADVIKIETATRPEYLNRGAQFRLLNEGKRSCALDLKTARGRELALDLAAECDIVIENFSPGTLDRLGLTFAELCARRPSTVLVSLSGLGQTGPYRDYVSYGSLLQAFSGWTRLVCPEEELADDRLGMVPVWADYLAGCMAATAALAGLAEARRTGRGLHLDVTVLESVLALMPGAIAEFRTVNEVVGNGSALVPVHDVFRCAGDDAWIAVVADQESELAALRRLLGLPRDEDPGRTGEALRAWCRSRDAEECIRGLQAAGVPAAASESLWSLLEQRDLWDQQLFRMIGDETSIAVPWREWPTGNRGRAGAAPRLGEHSEGVLDGILGLSAAELSRLEGDGVIR
jgi:crotonobetainyl-CoA:carnitine CoA-transferase CaiB-like acyl-CoA transferase